MVYLGKVKYILFVLLSIFYLQSAHALRADTSQLDSFIEKISALPLQQIETRELEKQLLPLLNDSPTIKSIKIIESMDNQVILRAYRKDNMVHFNSPIPSEFYFYPFKRIKIYKKNKVIGTVDIQYKTTNLFTVEESDWINSHVVKVGITELRPLLFEKEDGTAGGLVGRYLDLVQKISGLKYQFHNKPWPELMKGVKEGGIDLIPAALYTDERALFGLYGEEYISRSFVIYLKKDNDSIKTDTDLSTAKMAFIKNRGIIARVKKRFPNVTIIEKNTLEETLTSVLSGEADATLNSKFALNSPKFSEVTSRLKTINQHLIPPSSFSFFSTIKEPLLNSIIKKSFSSITEKQHQEMKEKIFSRNGEESRDGNLVNLSSEEEAWIKSHIVSVGVEQKKPVVFSNNGTDIDGITGDILKIISQKTGLKIKVHAADWSDLEAGFMDNKIDLLPSTFFTEDRAKYGLFGPDYFKIKAAVYTLDENKSIQSLQDLSGKKVAIEKNLKFMDLIQKEFPKIQVVITQDMDDSINQLFNGSVDALYGSKIVIDRKMRDEHIQGVKGIYHSSFPSPGLHFYSRIDEPLLHSILVKGLESISKKDQEKIISNWFLESTKHQLLLTENVTFDRTIPLLKGVFSVLLILVFSLIVTWFIRGRPKYLSLSDLLLYLSIQSLVMILITSVFIAMLIAGIKNELALIAQKENALILSSEFKESSDSLTRFSRLYSITGNAVYRKYYHTIIGMRDGKLAFPKNYNEHYWDEVISGRAQITHDGEIVNFHDRVQSLGLSEEEVTAISKSKTESDSLVKIENIAMYAMEGLFADSEGNFSITGNSDPKLAQDLLHNAAYIDAKAKITHPINDFAILLEWRTTQQLNNEKEKIQTIVIAITLLLIFTAASAIFAYFLMRKRIIDPIKKLEEGAKKIEQGDYNHHIDYENEDEAGRLAKAFNDMCRSISENEQHLITSQKLAESATQEKSNFLANMSHEIRTPMNAIIGLSYLALDSELNAKQHDYVTKIHNSGQNLLRIINDILDFSKIEAGKLDIEEIDFDLNDVINHINSVLSFKAKEKDLELLISLPSIIPTSLCGDPLRLGQILINLSNNAIKFTHSGNVSIHVQLIDEGADKINLRFEVKDTGIGINQKHQAKLFNSFSQADNSTTRKYGGSGLGLSISKKLVEIMGGEIGVTSELNKGSTFYFNVLFKHAKSEIKQTRQVIPVELQGMRILVVDDNSTAREVLTNYLDLFGFSSDEAASGEEAIKLLQDASDDNAYQMVLMDWKMLGIDGIEASRRIIQSKEIINKPTIVMVSAYDRDELLRRTKNMGINTFLSKPVNQSMLFDAIMNAFDKPFESDHVSNRIGAIPVASVTLCGAHLLLVEDNKINQQVAQELLEKAGITVSIANNGKEAIEAIEHACFDGILMDLQMPVMDGFEATKAIRNDQRFKDLPIIAMTANAMAGDRERCLEAGMNAHVSKPIEIKVLYATLAKWVKASNPTITPAPALEKRAIATTELKIPEFIGINVQEGLQRVAGNKRLYRSILLQFRESAVKIVSDLRAVLNEDDFEAATHLAHTLKGVAGNIGASGVQEVANTLESDLKQGKVSDLESGFKDLERQVSKVVTELSVFDEKEESKSSRSISDRDIDFDAITPLFFQLKTLLEDDNSEASEVLYEIETHLKGTAVETRLKQLIKIVDQFDYEKALINLQGLTITLNIAVNDYGDE